MKTLDDTYVHKVVVVDETIDYGPSIHVTKHEDKGYFLSTSDWGIIFVNKKGYTKCPRPNEKIELFSFEDAMSNAVAILDYYRQPLPVEDVEEWFNWITEGDDDSDDDVAVYRKIADLILAGKQDDAWNFLKKQDTYVREGVTNRILRELEYPTIGVK
jgi:hypothetical protein